MARKNGAKIFDGVLSCSVLDGINNVASDWWTNRVAQHMNSKSVLFWKDVISRKTHLTPDELVFFGENLIYLDEHGLVESGIAPDTSTVFIQHPKLTHKGRDFIEDDGGLSAILGVVTVRFHADTIKALVLDKIESSEITQEEKSKLKQHLESLSGEAWKEAGKYLIGQGLHHLPDAIGWLYKLISHVA